MHHLSSVNLILLSQEKNVLTQQQSLTRKGATGIAFVHFIYYHIGGIIFFERC